MNDNSPEKILKHLKQKASPRTQHSLVSIFAICKEQQERGLNDFSCSSIARLGKGRGVPAAQSMRNKTGKIYRTLLSSFENLNCNKLATKSSRGTNYSWIDEINDPLVRLQANILYSQKKEAQRMLEQVVPINQVIEVFGGDVSNAKDKQLTDLERTALEYLMSDEFLRRHRLERGKNASIVDADTKHSFFLVASLDAIKKALKYL